MLVLRNRFEYGDCREIRKTVSRILKISGYWELLEPESHILAINLSKFEVSRRDNSIS